MHVYDVRDRDVLIAHRIVDVFGKVIKNKEVLPLMMELAATAPVLLRHQMLKDMNLILLRQVHLLPPAT